MKTAEEIRDIIILQFEKGRAYFEGCMREFEGLRGEIIMMPVMLEGISNLIELEWSIPEKRFTHLTFEYDYTHVKVKL